MKKLENNWLTEGLMDSEFKQYILLAYLQHCREHFGKTQLYPPLADLVAHYRHLLDFQSNMDSLRQQFPKEMTGIDLKRLQLEYANLERTDEHMDMVREIIEFSLPRFRETIEEGKDLYERVEKQMEFHPVGLLPVYTSEGYLMLTEEHAHDVHVYLYQNSVITTTSENLHSLSFTYVFKEKAGLASTAEQIKLKLIRRFTHLPNPATWLCISRMKAPLEATLLPIAKRILLRKLGA